MPNDKMMQTVAPVYIVMDSNILIAQDLCGSLQASGPCRVINLMHPSELPLVLEQETEITAAFLEMRHDQILQAGIDGALAARGARIILTAGEDDETKALKKGWSMLVRPFTDAMIRETLLPSALDS